MTAKYILFVDDKDTEYFSFEKALKEWNKNNPDKVFEHERAVDVAAAMEQLRRHRFDAALFDLRMPSGEGGRGDGNDLVRAGIVEYGIPVGIISGHAEDVEPDLQQITMLRTFDKLEETAYSDAVAWLGSQWEMMIILQQSRGVIRKSGAAIFANRVWRNWENYERIRDAGESGLIQAVARQYAAHISEHLGNEAAAGWHPFEHYIQPAISEDRAQTGDIFRINDELWVLLTPACDLATKKARVVLLARCRMPTTDKHDPLATWDARVGELGDASLNRDGRDDRDAYFRSLINQATPGKHFLPPLAGEGPLFVEFKDVLTVPANELELATRVASIAPAFLSNLVQRFGAYISRTGQPNIDIRHFG